MAKRAHGKKAGALAASAEQTDNLQPADSWHKRPSTSQASIKPKGLSAFSQQSRFHVADTAASNQLIDIKGVNLSVGHRDLLQDAHVQLQAGVHLVACPIHLSGYIAAILTPFHDVECPYMRSAP